MAGRRVRFTLKGALVMRVLVSSVLEGVSGLVLASTQGKTKVQNG